LQQSKKKLIILLNYNLINVFLVFIVYCGTSVIHGDGPVGFFEVIVNGLIQLFASSLFLYGLLLSILSYKNEKFYIFPIKVIAVIITVILILISYPMINNACSNDKGYCRNWTIHFQ